MKLSTNFYNALNRKLDALEEQLNGGLGSGIFGHAGRPGLVGGSTKEGVSSKTSRAISQGIKSFKPSDDPDKSIDGGFTTNLKTGKKYELGKTEGYACGGFGTEVIVPAKDLKDPRKLQKHIYKYIQQNKKALSEKGACLGGWMPSDKTHPQFGNLILDVSRVTTDKKQATKWAVQTDQDAITDFKGFDFPKTEDLAKEFKLEKELAKTHGMREKERAQK